MIGSVFTNEGEKIFQDFVDRFHNEYVARHNGCNENDVERAFLYHVYEGLFNQRFMKDKDNRIPLDVIERIEEIR